MQSAAMTTIPLVDRCGGPIGEHRREAFKMVYMGINVMGFQLPSFLRQSRLG
jgi:hypothetical protein